MLQKMRIQKYKIVRSNGLIYTDIFCEIKGRKVEAWQCADCENFISVDWKKKEIKCKADK